MILVNVRSAYPMGREIVYTVVYDVGVLLLRRIELACVGTKVTI